MQYDPSFMVEYSKRLYSEANRIIITAAIMGLLGGIAVGAGVVVVVSLPHSPSSDAMFVSACFFGVIVAFFAVLWGMDRAFQMKLDAQRTLCILQIEINTRALHYKR